MSDPNTFADELKDAKANPELNNKGTEEKDTPNPTADADQKVDYKKKFSESSGEALKLLADKKQLELDKAELARLLEEKGSQKEEIPNGKITEDLYPGFEQLDEEAQKNLINYTNAISKRVENKILQDPSIAYARNSYNEQKWNNAFDSVVKKFPELKESREEFKAKYFKPSNVPTNIENILEDVSKIYLFDKAKEIGAREEKSKADRIDLERTTGGDKTPKLSRSLEDWTRMATENPAKFAQSAKEYNADLASGKI